MNTNIWSFKDTSELRLGNLLRDPETGCFLSVCTIRKNWFATCPIDRNSYLLNGIKTCQARPIPITQTILEESTKEKGDGVWSPHYSHSEFEFYLSLDNQKVDLLFFRQKVCDHLYYVHQLQNFYFIHTGKELELMPSWVHEQESSEQCELVTFCYTK